MEGEGLDIVYVRGTTSLPFIANPLGPAQSSLNPDGQIVTFGERGWGFALSELATLNPPFPKAGDRVQCTLLGVTHLWTVQPNDQGPAYDELDCRKGRIAANTIYKGILT